MGASQAFSGEFTHPSLSGSVRIIQPILAAPADGVQPLSLNIGLTSNHPVIQQLFTQLGPVLIALLPVLLIALLGQTPPAPPAPPAS